MLDCRIIKLRNGEVVALNQDGTPSKLYREALAYTGDVQKALDLWQTAYTDEFQLEHKSNTDDSAVLNDVLKFLDTNDATTSSGLSTENRAELVSVMQQFGYKRLSKLYKDLHAIYKAKGVLDMDGSKAVSTGLYTINDVYELDVDSVRDIISQIEKQGLIADIQLEDAEPYTNIIDSSRKNILGASERISEQEAENILKQEITDFSSKEDIENVIRNSDFSEHFSGRKRDALVKKFGALKRIPEVFIAEDGTLSATDRSLYNEVANTFPGDLSFEDLKPLKADVKYFKELSDKTWNENTDKVVNVLKEVEQKAANIGLDLVGISEKPGDREKVIELIDSAVKLLEKPSDKGLLNAFVANKSELIPATSKGYIIELSPKYRSYNVVRVNTNLSDGEMFDRHSLLKLSDNLYHIVNTKNKSEFYENLYQKLVDKKLKGVKTKDVTNKVQTLKDLEAFVMSRSVGFEVSNKEEASLAQLIFEHDSFPVREDFSALANIKTPEDYLKTDFVLDFYKYVVEEKLKNSSVYRNTLSSFVFSDNDISINRPIKSIEGLKYSEELKDYFSIKKDLSLNNLFKGESNIKLTADVKQFNNPNSVKEFQGTKYETKGYVIADESVDNILKVDGVLYKRAKGNVFAKIINIDTNYYSTNIAAPFEEEIVNKLNESSKIAFTKKEKPLEKVVEETKTTTEVTPVQPTNKQITKYVSQYLKDKFGSDISIMSEADMKRELAKRGYDSLQAMVQAYHGSPFAFDRFTTDKMGTGEGSQAFGWGLYFTDMKGLAEYYGGRNRQSLTSFELNGAQYKTELKEDGSYETTVEEEPISESEYYKAYQEYLKNRSLSNVYKVSLHKGKTPDQYTWLEWDKPVSESLKNKVREGLNKLGIRTTTLERSQITWVDGKMVTTTIPAEDSVGSISSGKDLYEYIAFGFNGSLNDIQKQASLFLLENGIDGIKYPAESISRGATSETARGFNYVVFDENAITIDERIQFLSTNDKVYGFYDESTKQIFLNESFLTSNSLIHEHWHAFKPILKDLANKGDLQAKLLIDTFRNTVDKAGVFNQAEFEARYDAQNQQKGTDWKSREELTIKREKLNSLIKEAALDLKAGRITNEEFREVVKQNSTIAPITNFIAPATKEQIIKSTGKKSDKVDQPIEEGKMVALRIDIPSLDRHNTWVVTVHEAKNDKDRSGTPISYTNVARIKNVKFNTSPTTSLNIAAGGEKNPIIRMNGNWSELPGESFEEKGKNAQKIVEEIKDNPEWVQVGSNPYRHSYFYDRNNGVPVTNAEEVVQIGGLVYAKNVTYGDVNSPEFTVKGLKDAAGNPVQFSILGEEGAQELDKYDESLSRLGQLELARKMKKDGQDPFSIRMATGWELNTVTDKWQYEIQPNMSIRKGVINNNNVFPGTTLEDLIDYPELFKAYPNLKNIEIKAVPYDEVDFEANYKPISNVIEISNYLLDETSKRLNPVLLHEIQHAIQVAEGYSPTSSQDIEEYINTIQNIGLKSEYSDIQDNSEEILFETLGYFKEAYKSVEEYVYNPWSQNITNTLKFFFKNIHGVNVKTPKTIKSYSINGDRVYRMDEIARETEDSSKGIIEGLNKEIAILFERNSVSSEKDLNQQLNTEKDEERLDDLNSTKRVLNNIKNRISEVENGNFKVETTEDSPELELQDLLEAYNNQNNTSLTQDDVINDITSYVENNRKDEDDIYYRSQSEVEARNIEERMNLSPEDRRMFVLSSTEDVDRADQLNISNGILGDMYSKISNVFSSEVYNPRPGESKEDYIERMREEIEANLLGENSEAYFERIATENNLTEEAKKSFKEKLKKFVKIFSDWLARQLGFNNITPAEAAKLTTTDVLDRVTTSMLRGDFRPEELVKNKLKNAKAKASELQASKDSGLEIITPVDLQNIEECT